MAVKQKQNNKNKKKSARQIALEVICAILDEGAYANIALNKALRSHSCDDRDRRFITELVYGTVKATGTLDWLLSQLSSRPVSKIDKVIVNILRMGLYQLFYLDKVPASAACNESTELAKACSHLGTAKFVNGILRSAVRSKEAGSIVFPAENDNAALSVALTEFHPEWLVKRWAAQFGMEEAKALCQYDNLPPQLTLRTKKQKPCANMIICRRSLPCALTL